MVLKEYLDINQKAHSLKKGAKVNFRPAVYVMVRNSKNEYLMIFNNGSKKWEIPGGGLEIGEDFIECGIRELKEETGFDIKIDNDLPFFMERDLSYGDDRYEHCLHFYYLGKLKSERRGKQKFAKGEKILKVEFFSLDKIEHLDICFWHKKAIEMFFKTIENKK